MIPSPGGSEKLRFPSFPRLAAQKRYVFHYSRAWRLRNLTFSIIPAPGGSETLLFFAENMLPARGKLHGRRGGCAVLLSFIVFYSDCGVYGVKYAWFSIETYCFLLNKCFPLEVNDMRAVAAVPFYCLL